MFLNKLQSWVYPNAFLSDLNLLICAPTGSGKTNVAVLTMLRILSANIKEGVLQRNEFKIIYLAPMKALAQELVGKFSSQLSCLGIVVKEYTGDMQLTKKEIEESQILVMTPEKFDVVTRKSDLQDTLIKYIQLLIIDEIHLLASDRGNVIESIVARTLRYMQTNQVRIRIVGLSATLPNPEIVGDFLHVDRNKGLYICDDTFRPVPLTKVFVGVDGDSHEKYTQNANLATYSFLYKVLKSNNQVK